MAGNRSRLATTALVLFACWFGTASDKACAQDGLYPSAPETISPDEPADRMARIEARLRELETRNQQLQERYDDMARKYSSLLPKANGPPAGAEARNADGRGVPGGLDLWPFSPYWFTNGTGGLEDPSDGEERRLPQGEGDGVRRQSGAGGAGIRMEELYGPFAQPPRFPFRSGSAVATSAPTRNQSGTSGAGVRVAPVSGEAMGEYVEERGPYVPDMRPLRIPAEVHFREGLQIRSSDDFFTLEFHNLTQLDFRAFSQTGDALHDNFVIPRQRWYFQGDVTPYVTYYTVINRGYGSLDVLDSWADFNFAPRYKRQFQLRAGRMKTPYSYEYIKLSANDLIAPERSLFISNFGTNRELGAMVHGQVFDTMMEYYLGVFNGQRRSFQDFNNGKDVFGLLNFRPFVNTDIGWLKYLNLTASVNGGDERNPTQPVALTTANDQSTTNSPAIVNVSPTFLIFNSKAFENGARMQWAGDVAYYYKSFTLLANYAGGFQDYSLQGSGTLPSVTAFGPFASGAFVGVAGNQRTRVPLEGWSVAATYFLTGEQISRRVYLTEPIRPFGYYNGRLNPGAIEIYSRFANLQLGDQVFTGGLADPKLWANRVSAIDTGVNWYLNHYVRFYFDWQYSTYNRPIFLSDSQSTRHNNLFWFRTQVFF